jgi:plasmid replication initiation protein
VVSEWPMHIDAMEKKEVIKHSAAVHIKNSVSVLQRRAWNVLLAYAYDSLPDKEMHQIKVQDLRQTLDFTSNNEDHLKQALENLCGCVVTWNTLHKDGKSWNATALLSHATIKNGICHYAYSSILREYLYNPRMYARISLSMQNKFSSKYSLALYELCVDYLNFRTGWGETPSISIPDLRTLMGLKDQDYPEFKKLNQKVIKPSVQELKKVSDLTVMVMYHRINRRIESVKFKVEKKKKPIPQKSDQKPLKPLREIVENHPLALRMQADFCLTARQSVVILERFPKSYITEVLELVEIYYKEGKVNNLAPYTLKALNEDFRDRKSSFEMDRQKRAEQAMDDLKASQNAKEDYQNLKGEFTSLRKEKTSAYLDSLSKEDRSEIFDKFLSEYVEKDPVMSPVLLKLGKNSPMIDALFHDFVCREFLSDECSEFTVFSQMKGFEIVDIDQAIRA